MNDINVASVRRNMKWSVKTITSFQFKSLESISALFRVKSMTISKCPFWDAS